ncbi:DUF2834 domain-containing protein [Streptococcus oricebi]|uniref:DUF2834 domain-containing protein n=1 Tax=Streptococcus oricebi TaxID=1547447 RepID=A0ABS5B586_9STRE|nr:DUF2834 domain-containing protein [Streptococcus oricebi]MBP2623997.1 hypothetical protein [Streptococcus oricebi]
MIKVYLLLSFIGAVLPLAPFSLFLLENGLNLGLFFHELFASYISSFFALDVIISALVFIAFVVSESLRKDKKWMMWSILGLVIGVSFSLPLFLLFREIAAKNSDRTSC